MLETNTFKGANVFMSRNLVPPEIFDTLLDALKLNGAEVFPCCDPSRNGRNDYHVISSPDHEKFEDLRAKGCNLLGPQCVLSCAKEHKQLPKQGFTCCLAMDGLKVLASGFDPDEKVKIEKLVKAMGGELCSKASLDVSFVIVKDVLAAKYKWALNVLKKPGVTASWLYQCWTEHRVVPQDLHRVLPLCGLRICVTGIVGAPKGDKFIVAAKWGCINIVTRKWLDQSIAKRACLNEESYPVQGGSASSSTSFRSFLTSKCSQEKTTRQLPSEKSSAAIDSNSAVCQSTGFTDSDVEATLSQNMSSMFSNPFIYVKEAKNEVPVLQPTNETSFSNCVADDSQSEDNDLYLADCRISLVGFESSESRKLVNMVRRGGGSRYVVLNDQLTHIIIGSPTEDEKRELRSLAASGVIYVVKTTWLEDCDREKREVPVLRQHVAYELLLPKDSLRFIKASTDGIKKSDSSFPSVHSDELIVDSGITEEHGHLDSVKAATFPIEKKKEEKQEVNFVDQASNPDATTRQVQENTFPVHNDTKVVGKRTSRDSYDNKSQNRIHEAVFKGKSFCFSKSFPADRRTEIVEWINQGGGALVDDEVQNVDFTIECHGIIPTSMPHTAFVSSHWVRSCLEDGILLDIGGHILYSPLPCQVPLPGFGSFRLCVSQFSEKDKSLFINLCVVLGAKFAHKLTRKVTHLLCKETCGPKYEAACRWGIPSVTAEWIYECVRQNKVVELAPFRPKEVSQQDQETDLASVSQFPSEDVWMTHGETTSELRSQSQDVTEAQVLTLKNKISSMVGVATQSINQSKKARHVETDDRMNLPSSRVYSGTDSRDSSHIVPDVAAAIEDLLEQTSKVKSLAFDLFSLSIYLRGLGLTNGLICYCFFKIHEHKSPERTICDKSVSFCFFFLCINIFLSSVESLTT
ncbi:unnamed protein product [Linum tenue]|uniref:BRCT domain-containing protein n=1 Tax=Linum tenue TaxID=586396 RepID=A0AAV0I943_9ROSI|nr:unnamed protein product [Linum tenue]